MEARISSGIVGQFCPEQLFLTFFSRAISKVQQMATDPDIEEIKQSNRRTVKREILDQLILKIKGREISKEQEDKWCEALKTEPDIVCPCWVIKP